MHRQVQTFLEILQYFNQQSWDFIMNYKLITSTYVVSNRVCKYSKILKKGNIKPVGENSTYLLSLR